MKNRRAIYSILFLLLFTSCGKEVFDPIAKKDTAVSNPVTTNTNSACSAFTLIKPKVDFLFLWDNSTSTTFINDNTKAALNNTINSISSRFDYHMMLAPLVVKSTDPVNYQAKLVTENPDGLSGNALSMKIDASLAAQNLNFSYSSGSKEQGIERAIDIIKANINNGVFRPNSYTYVVLMSNQDDSSWAVNFPPSSADQQNYLRSKAKEFLCLRGNYNPDTGSCSGANLNALEMRFMSITAFQNGGSCPGVSSWQQGDTYQKFSKQVYQQPYFVNGSNEYRQSDQNGRSDGMYDAYNICSQSDFTKIFDGINASINDTLIKHKYNYWPVASSGASSIDPNEIRAFKNGQELQRLSNPIPMGASGFTFTNTVQDVYTRFEPTPGERFEGYVIRLYGDAIVTYPECMRVQTQTPKEYFGYVNLQTKPVESSINLEINGQKISKSSTNGWELVKSGGDPQYFSSKNIKIKGPGQFCPSSSSNYCEETPVVNKSGYFLKLNGNAIYSNGATIEVIYDPST